MACVVPPAGGAALLAFLRYGDRYPTTGVGRLAAVPD